MDLGGLLRNIVPWFPPGDAQATPPEPQPPMQPSQMSAVDIYRQGVGLPPIEKVPPLDRDPAGFYPGRYDPFEIAAERTRASVMPIHGREESGASYPVQSALQAFPPLDLTPAHLPGTEPKDYLRELYRNPEILQKGIEQASNFNFGGTIGKAGGVGDMIRAYHGSPHDFERFDLSKIGTGEGAQAYGHGLYFAENEKTARMYRDQLTSGAKPGDAGWLVNGVHHTDLPPAQRAAVEDYIKTRDPKHLDAAGMGNAIIDAAPAGKMYEVGIRANPEHFLDWDKPLSEQPHLSKDVVNKVSDMLDRDPRGITGADMVKALSRSADQMAATHQLRDAGIPGIKYLDQGSRPMRGLAETRQSIAHYQNMLKREPDNQFAAEQLKLYQDDLKKHETGTRNFVVFDDKLIDILKKYGIAGIGALPAMNAYHYQDNQ